MRWLQTWRRTEPDGWELRALADFWRVARWYESEKKAGRGKAAMDHYLSHFTPILLQTIPEYSHCLRELDTLVQGRYSTVDALRNVRLGLPEGFTLLGHQDKIGAELQPELEKLRSLDEAGSIAYWRGVISDFEKYRVFVTKLVQQYGNFEFVAMTLPGTSEMTASKPVQKLLENMYHISTRWIRLFELAMAMHQPSRAAGSIGMFRNNDDLATLVRSMVLEYMIEADPAKIAAATERAKKLGRRPSRYRFWRPAETLRQLAMVTYEPGSGPQQRVPKPRRKYLSMEMNKSPALPIDAQRFEWAIKEVFNNAIAATSAVTVSKQGFIAKPLPQHAKPDAPPAVSLRVETFVKKKWWGKARDFVRLTITDHGVGIEPQHLPHVTKWAYSPRRAATEQQAGDPQFANAGAETREILIGGKGIGLPFAMTTFREHGGDLVISSEIGKGTTVVIELPTPGLGI